MHRLLAPFLLCAFCLPAHIQAQGSPPPTGIDEPIIHLQIDGGKVVLDVNMLIPATAGDVWSVLIDFEHMPTFISNLKESRVLSRTEQRVHVFQKGVASFGPITFAFESEREILLTPKEQIVARLLRGNLKSYLGTTKLLASGEHTRIEFHSEALTDTFIPPVFGRRFIENEAREQYLELSAEILRRNKLKDTHAVRENIAPAPARP